MEEFAALMAAINPYGALNWFAAALCGYVYNKVGGGLILFFALINVVFGIIVLV